MQSVSAKVRRARARGGKREQAGARIVPACLTFQVGEPPADQTFCLRRPAAELARQPLDSLLRRVERPQQLCEVHHSEGSLRCARRKISRRREDRERRRS